MATRDVTAERSSVTRTGVKDWVGRAWFVRKKSGEADSTLTVLVGALIRDVKAGDAVALEDDPSCAMMVATEAAPVARMRGMEAAVSGLEAAATARAV